MNGQRRAVAIVAGAAVLLSSLVLTTVFASYGWGMYAFLSTSAVVIVAIVARAVRVPVWGQALAMLAGLLLMLTWTFPSGHEIMGFIPDAHTFHHFGDLLSRSGHDIQTLAVPVLETEPLEFLVGGGIGLVAVVVDLLAVGLRHPALAGLPLLAIYSVPVAIHTDSVSWIPFAAGAAGFLWLLMTDHVDAVRRWGRRFTGDGRDVDTWEPSPLAAAGRRVGFAGLVLAVLLPLAVPGFSTGLLSRLSGYRNGLGPGNGTSTTGAAINPITTLRGELRQGKPIDLFQLSTPEVDPGYLRTAVADQITRSGFSPGSQNGSRPLAGGPDAPPAKLNHSLKSLPYVATATASQLNDRYLPLFGSTTKLQPPRAGNWRYNPTTAVVFTDEPSTAGQTWRFGYDSFDYTAKALRAAPRLDPHEKAMVDDIRVPASTRIASRVNGVVGDAHTEYDKVRAILDYFSPSNGFRYSLETRPGTSGSDIVDFLTNKRGYCEQYASAMAWMVRQAHIPSRVVVGYTHGSKIGNGDVYQVTSHEAHAWVEVYFPTFGWVPFDPTPSTEVSGAATFGWAPNPAAVAAGDKAAAGAADQPGKHGADDDPAKGQHGGPAVNSAGSANPGPLRWPFLVLGIVVLVALILSIPAASRALRHRRREGAQRRAAHSPAPDLRRAAAHAGWDDLMDTLVDLRLETDRSETPRGTAERVATEHRLNPPAADSLTLLAHAEERARYARDPLPAVNLPESSRQVRAALTARVSTGRRARARLAPPSVLRRWRTGLVSAVVGAVVAVGQGRTRAIRAIVPRRLRN